MSYAKYGLTATDATSSDYDKGIVKGPDGNYYQIDGFKRNQEEGVDTDAGKVFSSSLEKDSGKTFTNFNTAKDVEGALAGLAGETTETKPTEYSPRLATARARALQYEEDRVSGQAAQDLYNSKENPASGFLDRYKLKLGERLENGNYLAPDHSSTNSSNIASGANDVSMDASEFARTGRDNRNFY